MPRIEGVGFQSLTAFGPGVLSTGFTRTDNFVDTVGLARERLAIDHVGLGDDAAHTVERPSGCSRVDLDVC